MSAILLYRMPVRWYGDGSHTAMFIYGLGSAAYAWAGCSSVVHAWVSHTPSMRTCIHFAPRHMHGQHDLHTHRAHLHVRWKHERAGCCTWAGVVHDTAHASHGIYNAARGCTMPIRHWPQTAEGVETQPCHISPKELSRQPAGSPSRLLQVPALIGQQHSQAQTIHPHHATSTTATARQY